VFSLERVLSRTVSVFIDAINVSDRPSDTLFITVVPNTKLCVWGEEDSGGHVL
jgi:hypothetical protein